MGLENGQLPFLGAFCCIHSYGGLMIKAVSFDFYNTLVRFWPPLEEIQRAACQKLGLTVQEQDITRGYAVADVFFNRENEDRSLSLRSDEDRLEFFGRYEQLILETRVVSAWLRWKWGVPSAPR